MKKGSGLGTLEIACLVLATVPNIMPHQPAVDAAHARAAAIFRLLSTVVGICGFIAIQVAKRARPQANSVEQTPTPILEFDLGQTAPGGEVRVAYRRTREDGWRCNMYVLWHHAPTTAGVFLLPVI